MENAPPPSPARGSLTVIGRLAFVLDHNSPVVVKVSNPTKNDGYSVSHLVPKNSLIFARNQAITGKSKVEKISVAGTTPCYFSSIDVSGTQNRGFHDSREQVLWRMGGGNLHYDCSNYKPSANARSGHHLTLFDGENESIVLYL